MDIAPSLVGQVSPEQTIFVFAREVGQRMPLAAVKLAVSDLPINEIAYDTGFNDLLYFTRQFKKKVRTSPSSYLKVSAL